MKIADAVMWVVSKTTVGFGLRLLLRFCRLVLMVGVVGFGVVLIKDMTIWRVMYATFPIGMAVFVWWRAQETVQEVRQWEASHEDW